MNYIDYLSNAEKHYCFCNNVISEKWEEKFVTNFKNEIVNKLYNSLKVLDKNNYLGIDVLQQSFDRGIHITSFTDDYSIIKPKLINLFDNVVFQICDIPPLSNEEKKKEQKKYRYLNFAQTKYENYRKTLYNIYLNTYYLSGYIFEGVALYSTLKLLGFDDSINLSRSAIRRKNDLCNYNNYDSSQLSIYVMGTSTTINTTLQTKFAGVNKHKFNDYVLIIRNHSNLDNYSKTIEFVGQDITDANLKQMVDNWDNNILRYKQFSSFDLSKADLLKLLKLSSKIIEQVKHI